jgi:hypothetical protein|tara:strand:- start:470 stop:637 length:168 start_codon:yes stop_codon:yes gene_type:complete
MINESGSGSQYQALQQTFNSSGGRQANGAGVEIVSDVSQFDNLQLSNGNSRGQKQ